MRRGATRLAEHILEREDVHREDGRADRERRAAAKVVRERARLGSATKPKTARRARAAPRDADDDHARDRRREGGGGGRPSERIAATSGRRRRLSAVDKREKRATDDAMSDRMTANARARVLDLSPGGLPT